MPTPDSIKRFVQDTLGCGCPEEVFRSIDVQEQVPVGTTIILPLALIIGHRLLIYVMHADTPDGARENIEVLVRTGTQERDRKSLNRFRLVVVTDDGATGSVARAVFEQMPGRDDKVHLHVITHRDMLPVT